MRRLDAKRLKLYRSGITPLTLALALIWLGAQAMHKPPNAAARAAQMPASDTAQVTGPAGDLGDPRETHLVNIRQLPSR